MEDSLTFIPPYLHSQIYQTFYKGFQVVLSAILEILLTPPAIPVPAVVKRSFTLNDHGATFYFDKGGNVMHIAKDQSYTYYGDGTFEEVWEDEGDVYTTLPMCANDEEFGLARKMLGLDPNIEWGPYNYGFG